MDEATPKNLPLDSTVDMENKENYEGLPVLTRVGTPQARRHKGVGGVNLRKSLAWNNAFFTDEGILNPMELSALSRSMTDGARNLVSGIHEEGLTPLTNKCFVNGSSESHALGDSLELRSKFYPRSQSKERVASRLSSEAVPSSFETPKGQFPYPSVCKSSSQSLAANPQKRLPHACLTNPMAKIPNVKGSVTIPKAPKAEVHARKGSHNLLNVTSAHVSQTDSSMNTFSSMKKATNSTKSHVGYNGSSSTLPTQPSMHVDLHVADAPDGYKKLQTSSLSAYKVNQNSSSGCYVKPSALRMPSPSLGFFVLGKPALSHAVNFQKIADMQSSTDPNIERHIHRPVETSDSKPVKHDLAVMKKISGIETAESPGKTSGKHCSGSFDSRYVVKAVLDMHPSTDITESSDSQKSCCQVANKEPDYDVKCESAEVVNIRNTALGKPNVVQVHRCNTEMEDIALSSLVDGSGAYSQVDASFEVSDACAKTSCPVLQEESSKHNPDTGENVSVSNILSDRALFSSFLEKHMSDKLNCEPKDCLVSQEVPGSSPSSRNADTTDSPLIDENVIPVCQMQCQLPNDVLSIKSSSNTGLPIEQDYSTSSTGSNYTSMNVQSRMKRSISAAEGAMDNNDGTLDIAKQDVKLKCQLKPQPFSEEWIAAAEAFGEEILKMKTGAVQNSPPEKVPPEPNPWSPVKKIRDVGPYDCTKYTKDKIPSSTGTL